jgi:hypothetical protein
VANRISVAIVSDIHYASAAEQARGADYELRGIENILLRTLVRLHRRFIWRRYPFNQNHLLDQFVAQAAASDYVVANGDYSCNTGFIGVSDDGAFASAKECLGKLREKFGSRLRATFGDHELGKLSFFGGQGGMRLASWHRAVGELGLEPFWRLDLGQYVVFGVVSSLIALPVFEPDTLIEERPRWEQLRAEHMNKIREAFSSLQAAQKILLFCHDPTALPFLLEEPEVSRRVAQIEQTIIGHLHSNLILWKSRVLSGIPRINFLGHTPKRLTAALNQARNWRPFNVRLCPALGGIELLNDGGYYVAHLDASGPEPARFEFHALAVRQKRPRQ